VSSEQYLPNFETDTSAPPLEQAATESRITGEVLRIVFANDDGSYTVLKLIDDHGNEITAVGSLDNIVEGQFLEAVGKWHTHKTHGREFRVNSFRVVLPKTEDGIQRYLASAALPGVGPKLAERIVSHFGTDTVNILDHYSKRLSEVPGLGSKKIESIIAAWHAHRSQSEQHIFLQGLGLTANSCQRLIHEYGNQTADVVRENPYRLIAEVRGIGFISADRIARQAGIDHRSPLRLAAGVLYTLDKLSENGHTCYPRPQILQAVAETLEVEPPDAEKGLQETLLDGRAATVVTRPGFEQAEYVYKRRMFINETFVAKTVCQLLHATGSHRAKPLKTSHFDTLNPQQRQAFEAAFHSPISIITGGPGVGKTTVVGQIVEGITLNKCRLKLAAPTGRAAKRLSETSALQASTIHRMLKWDPANGTFVYNQDRPLKCDFLIIDEVSMVDTELARHLFAAIRPGTHIILVGDRDQLPSVGPGSILQDLIHCELIPVTELTQVYRQKAGSRIILNAHALNRGKMPNLMPAPKDQKADFYWIEQDDPERVAEMIGEMVADRIPTRFQLDPLQDIQVLTPMNRGNCGTWALNQLIQDQLNGDQTEQFFTGHRYFKRHDRVMQVVNNYDKGVFNGEQGIVQSVASETKTFDVLFQTGLVSYNWDEADQLKLAYAVTVHKSQGNEFPAVVLPVLTQHYVMLQRNLIYTAMTRAKQLLIMIGTRKALSIAIRNNRPTQRHTLLPFWLDKYQNKSSRT
jgi:exodeoxyribonuclease V alpha subunit